ncbi:hypothetical protein TNCV_1667311 [Trichonephila clavipes]|nr:hypothetical protein TNCV_1667311 [Trichonephila clavipes]
MVVDSTPGTTKDVELMHTKAIETQWPQVAVTSFESEFCNGKKGGNRLVPGLDYMVDALKLPKKLPGVLASHYRSVYPSFVLMEHNTSSVGQFRHFWSIASFKCSSC